MNEKTKDFLFWGMLASALVLSVVNATDANATQPHAVFVQDHEKAIIKKTPYEVEVCSERTISGDKTADTLKGAILGGVIGNNIKGEENGGAIGAIIGGMLGHSNSNADGGTQLVCNKSTRYKETMETIYSHSTISFTYQGKSYTVRFKK